MADRLAALRGALRIRLIAVVVLVLVLGVAAADATAYFVLRAHLAGSRVDILTTAAQRVESARPSQPIDLTETGLDSFVPPSLAAVLLDADGRVLLSLAAAAEGPLVDETVLDLAEFPEGEQIHVSSAGNSPFLVQRVRVPPTTDLRVALGAATVQVDSVLLGLPLAADRRSLNTLLHAELVAGAIVVALCVLLARGLLGLGLRPIRDMARAAHRIAAGEDGRIPQDRPGSETSELARALNEAFDVRAEAEARSRAFLADAAHELRTPVTAVRAWADLHAAGALPVAADVDEAMASIGAESRRMQNSVGQMLQLARLDAGAPLDSEPVDLRAIASDAVRSLDAVGQGRLNGPSDGAPVVVIGDAEAVRRIVDNLVVNALRYSEGDSPVQVEATSTTDGSAEVVVVDRGPGLDAAERELAFDRFWRGEVGRARPGGSGLGLAIARDLARRQGGDVMLRPAEPTGLRAVLRLPLAPPFKKPSGYAEEAGGRPGADRSGDADLLTTMASSRIVRLPQRHPRLIIAAWLLFAVGVVAANHTWGGTYENDIDLPGTQATAAADLLDEHAGGRSAYSGQVVLKDPGGISSDREAVTEFATKLAGVPGVASVSPPLAEGTVSPDGSTAYLTLGSETSPRTWDETTLSGLRQAAEELPPNIQESWAGVLGEAIEPREGGHLPEVIGLVTALMVLLLLFGSVLAAMIPLVSATLAGIAGVSLLGLLAASFSFATQAPTLALMIGLGCGIDYGLFLTTRARQHLIDGAEPDEAIARAVRHSGHAVLVAAGTVAVALLGLYASGITFIGQLGVAAVVTLATAALAAVTLVPASLALLGRRVDRFRVRQPVAESEDGGGRWAAFARRVCRRPWQVLLGTLALLATLTIPLFSMQLGHIDEGSDPVGTTTRTAYDNLGAGFGPGFNGTFIAVLDLGETADAGAATAKARDALAQTTGVESISPFTPTSDGQAATATIVPVTGPEAAETQMLFDSITEEVAPAIADETGARLLLTGQTVGQLEFGERVTERLPLIIGLVVLGAFVLLTVTFRSPVVALKAAAMNLVSIGASYGVLVAVFQWQWGSSLLGISESVPIESFVPMMMFAVIFGLSMDYEVFLLSEVRAQWLAGHDTGEAVANGLSSTARVISAAALIMMSVFLGFALNDDVAIKMIAFGLAVSVAIDATIVRLLLVPATMVLLGDANWWAPKWLRGQDRRIAAPTDLPALPK